MRKAVVNRGNAERHWRLLLNDERPAAFLVLNRGNAERHLCGAADLDVWLVVGEFVVIGDVAADYSVGGGDLVRSPVRPCPDRATMRPMGLERQLLFAIIWPPVGT